MLYGVAITPAVVFCGGIHYYGCYCVLDHITANLSFFHAWRRLRLSGALRCYLRLAVEAHAAIYGTGSVPDSLP